MISTVANSAKIDLESYFERYRNNIIGNNLYFDGPYGRKKIIYADWIASGRLYEPIEKKMIEEIGPWVANTHTETNVTGCSMTMAYHKSKEIIKKHINAGREDILISSNSGMTGVLIKFQRILGLKLHESFENKINIKKDERPVVFVTHMEHHSNQTSWLETIAEVKIIGADEHGLVDLDDFKRLLEEYKDRKIKYAAITSCSNVTGISTPYHQIAEMIHAYEGYCFVDFACSAPYVNINMHPENPAQKLDAIYFSPHKFLGGPGSSGILVFNSGLYKNRVPDHPGGGTVAWTNPWGEHKYFDEIEAREDGGTPAFLQTIRVALCVKLKEEMGVENILEREHELIHRLWVKLENISGLHILADKHVDRLGAISFYIEQLHFNLAVILLNDRYGIQARGGCSCAGTYGHYLLKVSYEQSKHITDMINSGILAEKPGWIRLSLHPTMTNEEVDYIANAIEEICMNHQEWAKDYVYNNKSNEYYHLSGNRQAEQLAESWFELT
jgi:selenocysteine lyase/cysteine desulfurase